MSNERSVSDAATLHKMWVPDNPDGSGWANIDWVSALHGSRYHYQHGEELAVAETKLPPFYLVRTRSESQQIPVPHENTYYIPGRNLHDFLEEMLWNGGAERIWHIEPVETAPDQARVE